MKDKTYALLRKQILDVPELADCIRQRYDIFEVGPHTHEDGKVGDDRITPMITFLADPIAGFYCTACDRGATSQKVATQNHWLKYHPDLKNTTPTAERAIQWPYMQSVSWDTDLTRYFPVLPPPQQTASGTDPDQPPPRTFGELLEDEEDRLFPDLEDEAVIDLEGINLEGFFNTVGAAAHVSGYDHRHLRQLVSLPDVKKESELVHLRLPVVDYVVRNCERIGQASAILRHRILHPDAG